MKVIKTWQEVKFIEGKAEIDLSFNYQSNDYSLSHGHNDQNVTFDQGDENISVSIDRAKCVMAALKYIKQELNL